MVRKCPKIDETGRSMAQKRVRNLFLYRNHFLPQHNTYRVDRMELSVLNHLNYSLGQTLLDFLTK